MSGHIKEPGWGVFCTCCQNLAEHRAVRRSPDLRNTRSLQPAHSHLPAFVPQQGHTGTSRGRYPGTGACTAALSHPALSAYLPLSLGKGWLHTLIFLPFPHLPVGTEFLVTKPSAKARHQEEIFPTHKSKHSSLQSPVYVFQCQNNKYFSSTVCRTGRSPALPRPPAEAAKVRGRRANRTWQEQTQTQPLLPSAILHRQSVPSSTAPSSRRGELHREISCCKFKHTTNGGRTILLLNELISLSTY